MTRTELVAEGLSHLREEFEDELERAPTSAELLELLAEGVRGLPDDAITGFDPKAVIGLEPKHSEPVADRASEVSELNDAAFSEAVELLAGLAKAHDEPPTLDVLLAALLAGLQAGDPSLTAIEPRLKPGKRHRRPKVGDVVAIPRAAGGDHRAILVARNHFGTAWGILDGERPALIHPIYTDDEQVRNGRWRVVGHDEALLSLFPSEPEWFSAPWPNAPAEFSDHGEHGEAERPDGTRRLLTAEEARQVDFGQYVSKGLEERLDARPSDENHAA